MSKLQLKKELQGLDAEQLRGLILELYDVSKEAKNYLEFYINPDVDKLLEKYAKSQLSEFARSKWGRSKARISVIKRNLKQLMAYQPGYEAVTEAHLAVIKMGLDFEKQLYFSDTLIVGIALVLQQLVEHADKNEVLSQVMERLEFILGPDGLGTENFRKFLQKALERALESVATELPGRK